MRQARSVRRTLVGSMLRQYREAQGYRLEEAASTLGCDRSKISRIETGERGIRHEDLRKLLTEYGIDEDTQGILAAIVRPRSVDGWWQDYGKVLSDAYLDFIVAEGVASHITLYAPIQVPEVLWTPAYGRAVVAADPFVPEEREASRVEAALAHRGAILFDRKPEVTVVIGEGALRQQVGDHAVMRGQLDHLARLASKHRWFNIRILPFTAGAHAGGEVGAFSVLRFSALADIGLVHVAGAAGGICLDDAPAISAYTKTFTQLSWYALSREQSQVRLRELAKRSF